jgi:hypothetical protein
MIATALLEADDDARNAILLKHAQTWRAVMME